jgi:Zn-dependent protease with chaperone function
MYISRDDFIHPEDQAALDSLNAIPLLPTCIKSFMSVFHEQLLHNQNMAEKIRLGPGQLPEIYNHLPPICQLLGIEEPELYLEMDPTPNAYTFGDTQISITLTSGLIDALEEDELKAVIAHECGHIVCRHTLFKTMVHYLSQFGPSMQFPGPLKIIGDPVVMALNYWNRRSELSADRAAAAVMKGPQSVVETMIRLSGGPKSITEKVNIDSYIQQAQSCHQLLDSTWDKLMQGYLVRYKDHPFSSIRTKEIMEWCQTDAFTEVVHRLNEMATLPRCPACAKPVKAEWKFCGHCGALSAIATK